MVLAMASCSGSSTDGASSSTTNPLVRPFGGEPAGDLSRAETEYQATVKKDPTNKYAWCNLGVIAQARCYAKTAETDYLKSIGIDPKFEAALYQEGLLNFQRYRTPDAIDYISRAVASNPNDANAHWVLGMALTRIHGGPHDRASKELNAALKLNPALVNRRARPDVLRGCNRRP
jgi:tetratricopeptide (TPR) repeat protein